MAIDPIEAKREQTMRDLIRATRQYQRLNPYPRAMVDPSLEWLTAKGIRELAIKTVGRGPNLMHRYYLYLDRTYPVSSPAATRDVAPGRTKQADHN